MIGAVAWTGSAPAGITYGELGLVFTGTTTNWTTYPGRADQATYSPCGSTTRLVGVGGWVIEAGSEDPERSNFALGKGYNVAIHPFEQNAGAPMPDSTFQAADNHFSIDNDLTLGEATVCAENIGSVSYPTTRVRTQKRERTTARVACGGSRHVLSGGALTTGPFGSQRLVSSAPYDSGDPGSKPDDGWSASADNLKRKRRAMEVFAICSNVPGLSYVEDGISIAKRSRKHVELSCPAGELALGGGVTHTARFGKATLVAARAGSFPAPFERFVAELDNLSRKRAAGELFAICHA